MRQFCFALICIFPLAAWAKTPFTASMIDVYLTNKNPFVSAARAPAEVALAKAQATEGIFDTTLGFKYDDKRYPSSDGKLTDLTIEKELQSGLTLLAGYRKAEGVQEYNNIKTGDEGEARVGVKLPVVALFSDTNKHLYRYRSATLNAVRERYSAQERIRLLRYDATSAYYTLLYRYEAHRLEQALLEKARNRSTFIAKKVAVGEFAPIERLELKRQILQREQRLHKARTAYETALRTFTAYLDMEPTIFSAQFSLPALQPVTFETDRVEQLFIDATQRRPDLKRLEAEDSMLTLEQQYSTIDRYPKMDIALTGVHDFEYDNGFKLSVNMRFPIERRRYSGTQKAIQSGKTAIAMTKRSRELTLSVSLKNLLDTQKMLLKNIESAGEEVMLCTQLEQAERKRFNVGEGSQLLVNQREHDTLEAKLRKLDNLLQLNITVLKLRNESGIDLQEH